jgi:hypothetical protein
VGGLDVTAGLVVKALLVVGMSAMGGVVTAASAVFFASFCFALERIIGGFS